MGYANIYENKFNLYYENSYILINSLHPWKLFSRFYWTKRFWKKKKKKGISYLKDSACAFFPFQIYFPIDPDE